MSDHNWNNPVGRRRRRGELLLLDITPPVHICLIVNKVSKEYHRP